MIIKNPYIEKVEAEEKIFTKEAEIYTKQGRRQSEFENQQKIHLEIGTGLGNFFSQEVVKHPYINFIGMEIKYKRLFKTAEKTYKAGGENFFLIKEYAENIDKIFAEGEIDQTYIFFPDPWPKDRHAKHRLMQESFLEKLYTITEKGWKFIFKTDAFVYFQQVEELLKNQSKWKIQTLSYDYENELEQFDKKRLTEFESMFRSEKIKINYLECVKN